ncbi:hypothetical protein [Actinotignum schaalii]|nr:hypothetical protein [Actinotignum schaalii]WQN45213.1 hypothetical protein U4A90_00520 [Actinotignum schaalii]
MAIDPQLSEAIDNLESAASNASHDEQLRIAAVVDGIIEALRLHTSEAS